MRWSEQDTASSIPERFEHQVRSRAEHSAIGAVTYSELGAQVDRYAGALARRAEPGQRLALLLRHDVPLLAGALAALRCGMTVVTLNPGEPAARLRDIRIAVAPQLLLTDQPNFEQARAAGFEDAGIVRVGGLTEHPPRSSPGDAPAPDSIAFLVCTSGSAGKPKVVMQSHRNMLHNVLRYTNGLGIEQADRLGWLASLSGGQGLATALTGLLNGATLCPFPIAERGVTGLAEWLERQEVSVFDTIPSVLRNFAQTLHDERVHGVRLVRIASEGALRSDFEAFTRHFPRQSVLASVLASSEGGIIAQIVLSSDRELSGERLPVGLPAEGIEVLLLDEDGAEVADGELGEIVLRGRYLSPGYWGDEQLTAERFTQDEGARRFRTGDLARRGDGGVLTIEGRADRMVKVRGHRLQLEEVEAALAAQPVIAAAAVALRSTARGDSRIVAYVAPRYEGVFDEGELRRALSEVLPGYAIPAWFVVTAQLPLTPHGKVDRERLGELEPATSSADQAQTASSETEELLAGLWSEAFERLLDVHDAFLELGGDSLIAAVIAAGVGELFGVELDLRVFVANPTVASLAALIEQRRGTGRSDDLPPLRRTIRSGPLSSSQRRMWQAKGESDSRWNVAVPFAIRGPLDVDSLRGSIDELVRRHELLRTTFIERDGHPLAVVRPAEPLELAMLDLRSELDPQARAQEILAAELQRPFDLRAGPLVRLLLLRLGDAEHQLLRITHHIIHDAVSWQLFFNELAALYTGLHEGKPAELGDAPELQYLDYAIWEREWVRPESARFQAEVQWWQRRFELAPPGLQLPFMRAEPDPGVAPGIGVLRWGIAPHHGAALDRLGREAGATYYMTRLAAFAGLLAIEGGVDDLVIGTPASVRTRIELQRMFGPLINFVILRIRFADGASYRQLLSEVRRSVIDIGPHVNVPWEDLRPALVGRNVAIPRVSATFHSWAGPPPMRFASLELEPLPRMCGLTWGFRLGVNRYNETELCWTEFDTRTRDPDELKRFLSRLQALIGAICAEPDRSLRDLHSVASLA